jgi:hypothetical protein
VNTNFSEHEMEVIVNAGLKSLLQQGQMPIQKTVEGILNVLSPSEARAKNEDPYLRHRDGSQSGARLGPVESERGPESDSGVGVRPVLVSEVAGGAGSTVLIDPAAGPSEDVAKDPQAA